MQITKIKIPTTVEELAATFPEMARELIQQGIDSAVPGAVEAERTRIIGLASVQFGDEAGEAFKKVVKAGLAVKQFAALHTIQPKKTGRAIEEGILEALYAADVNVGSGSSKPFMIQVDAYVSIHKCSKTQAMREILKTVPGQTAHRAYLAAANRKGGIS